MTPAEWVDDAAGPVVRPYAMVRGRTRSERYLFDLVAFVVAVVDNLQHWVEMQPEHQAILTMCRRPRSVTEVAARMNLPVGVVRVLLSDLLDARAIRVREPADPVGRPSVQVIREVLEGLRAL
ncbi:Protein of unknown function [Streptomyces sp. DvalAA-14]|uniref:DUF742 domain-containing protein n=1 Tax=unclassified Streptomyces TaxID=2593676 RepID=UPI00081B939C|nr:DUF742 domain-containing protein [Streptomyces sp. DvalAA-14]SCD54066.1 Protein of unknown function [Streptomyces sp. DvalAA-14]